MIIPRPISTTQNIIRNYKSAKAEGTLPFWIVFAIAIYTPFEEFIIKWLPGAELLRFLPELTLYVVMATVLGQKLIRRQGLKSTPIDALLLLFFISSIISIIVNGSNVFVAFSNLRALWRYLTVFYIIANLEVTLEQIVFLLNSIKVAGVLQGLLAGLQYFMPSNLQQIFAPKQLQLGSYERLSPAEGKLKAGSVYGMFANPAVLASFLIISLTVAMTYPYTNSVGQLFKVFNFASISILSFGIYATKKRAPLLIALLVPIVVLYFQKRIKSLLKLSWVYIFLLFIMIMVIVMLGTTVDTSFTGAESKEESVDFISYIAQIFSADYYEHSSEASRGWVISTVIHSLWKSGSWFGFGPDLENLRQTIYDLLIDGSDRAKILSLKQVKDVYWMALLAYYGPVGFSIFSLILWRLFQAAKYLIKWSKKPEEKALGVLFCTLTIITIFYNFIELVLEVRPYSYYYWLVAGCMINVYSHKLKERKECIASLSR